MRKVRCSLSLVLGLRAFLFFSIQSAISVIAVLSAARIFLSCAAEFSTTGERIVAGVSSGPVVLGTNSLGCGEEFKVVIAGLTVGRGSSLGTGEVLVFVRFNTPWQHPAKNTTPLMQNR